MNEEDFEKEMEEENEIKESMDEAQADAEREEKMDLPEAPVSITIRGYYKGFSVLITKRKKEMEEKELSGIQKAIDNMVNLGFKPSWNDKTNGDHKEPPAPLQRPCNHEGCQGTQTFRSGVSKKTNKPWKAWFCDLSEEHADFVK